MKGCTVRLCHVFGISKKNCIALILSPCTALQHYSIGVYLLFGLEATKYTMGRLLNIDRTQFIT